MRTVVVSSFLLFIVLRAQAQSCDCPAAGTCFTCQGGISSFTLRFNGTSAQTITAADQGGTVFSQVVNPNQTFTFVGTTPNDKFQGSEVDLTVDGSADTSIPVNCEAVFVGDTFGSFTVVAAQSKTGGALCCSAANSDTTLPQITGCPDDVIVETENSCEAIASWTPPTATDNCSAALSSTNDPGNLFPLGTTIVTYTATDPAGNVATCTFNVTVKASGGPVVSNCPADITLHTYDDSIVATWTAPTATPHCGNLSSSASHQPGDQFGTGTTKVSYEFSDDTNNKTLCVFNVTVIKDEAAIEVSQALTPNGDGINDTWELSNIEQFKDNKVFVVDRWGNKVYQANGYNNSDVLWNGIGINGSKVPVGTYFYTIEVRVKESIVRKTGFIEVVY